MAVTGINYVGTVTLAANTAVELVGATYNVVGTPLAGTFTLVPAEGSTLDGMLQIPSLSYTAGTTPGIPLSEGDYKTGGALFYVYNSTASSITFTVKFVSTL